MEAGRPPVYENPEDLAKKVDEYFEYVQGDYTYVCKTDDDGKEYDTKVYTREPEPVTITGLCLYLGFESRQSFYDYEKRTGFSYIIKRSRMMVENYYEKTAQSARQQTFHIFALKNMGWSDKQEVDHTTKGESINVVSLGSGINPET